MLDHRPSRAGSAIDEPRRIKVVCIGAGYSGILTAIRFPQRISNLDLTIYEKNDDIGGTWYENTYVGVGCDVPSHVYQFTFAANPNWSKFYAEGAEIQQYLKDVADRYDVNKYVRLQHFFQKAEWDERHQQWIITLQDLRTNRLVTDTADVLVKGTGILNRWKWPDIPGLDQFEGPKMHTAKWDPTFDWTDKNVALIGAGSSGIQVLPQLQPRAKRVSHFVRGRTWISPVGYAAEVGGGLNLDYTPDERKRFMERPAEYLQYRHRVEGTMNKSQLVTFKNSEIQKEFWRLSIEHMREKLKKKPEVFEKMLPAFPPGCRRLTPGPGYLEALVEDNVDFIATGIQRCTKNGILDNDGNYHELDAIICATGFDYTWNQDETPITGRGGITLGQMWDPDPIGYMGVAVPNMPNFFMYLGPAGAPGSGSFITMLEFVVEYIIKCVKKLQREHIASMEPTEESTKEFTQQIDQYMEKTIFTANCRSWFKRNQVDGPIVGVWPGSPVHARVALENPRFEDYHYVRMPRTRYNAFAWFGNGLTVAQERGEKTTTYLDEVDIPPIINRRERLVNKNREHVTEAYVATTGVTDRWEKEIVAEAMSTMPS